MSELTYRGSPPVGPAETQALLAGSFAAVWSPPMNRGVTVAAGDRLWLLWQNESTLPRLLGAGVIILTPDGVTDWTERTAPGIVEAARRHGYGGPTNMAFFRLANVWVAPSMPELTGLGNVPVGATCATAAQLTALTQWLGVESRGGPTRG